MCAENELSSTLNQRLMTYEELLEENDNLSRANRKLKYELNEAIAAKEEWNLCYRRLAEYYDKLTGTQVSPDEKKPTTITITVTV